MAGATCGVCAGKCEVMRGGAACAVWREGVGSVQCNRGAVCARGAASSPAKETTAYARAAAYASRKEKGMIQASSMRGRYELVWRKERMTRNDGEVVRCQKMS